MCTLDSIQSIQTCTPITNQNHPQLVARAMYSNPPLHGAQLVKTILQDADLKKQWFGVSGWYLL